MYDAEATQIMTTFALWLFGDFFVFLPLFMLGMGFIFSLFTAHGSDMRRRGVLGNALIGTIFLLIATYFLVLRQTAESKLAHVSIGLTGLSPAMAIFLVGISYVLLIGIIITSILARGWRFR